MGSAISSIRCWRCLNRCSWTASSLACVRVRPPNNRSRFSHTRTSLLTLLELQTVGERWDLQHVEQRCIGGTHLVTHFQNVDIVLQQFNLWDRWLSMNQPTRLCFLAMIWTCSYLYWSHRSPLRWRAGLWSNSGWWLELQPRTFRTSRSLKFGFRFHKHQFVTKRVLQFTVKFSPNRTGAGSGIIMI